MTILWLIAVYLLSGLAVATAVVVTDYDAAPFRPSHLDRFLVALVLPWGFLAAWAEGDDPWDWAAYAWSIVARGVYLDD